MCPFLLPSALPPGSQASSLSVEHARDGWIQMKAICRGPGGHTEGTHVLWRWGLLCMAQQSPCSLLVCAALRATKPHPENLNARPAKSVWPTPASTSLPARTCALTNPLFSQLGVEAEPGLSLTQHILSLSMKDPQKRPRKKSKKYLKWEFPGGPVHRPLQGARLQSLVWELRSPHAQRPSSKMNT